MKSLFYVLQLFLTTVSFLSWIPIPKWGYTGKGLYRMGIFFPMVGGILGGITALIFYVSTCFFPYTVAVAVTLFLYGWMTGAFHEDAMADVADGMGGRDPQSVLEIMRDSCIGTYGAMALISSYVLRYAALTAISLGSVMLNLIVFAAVSRMSGVFFLTLAQQNELPAESLSRTVLFSNQWGCFLLGAFTTVVLIGFSMPENFAVIAIVFVVIPLAARRYFLLRTGAITGDCAGFVIHASETLLHVLATVQ